MKFADPTGMQVEDVDGLINYYKKLSGTISGMISDCIGLEKYEVNLYDAYTSVNYTPTPDLIVYTGEIPVGVNYINRRPSCIGGCTEATILSVLDMYKINTYNRDQINFLRQTNSNDGNIKNTFDKLTVGYYHTDGLVCDVEKDKNKFLSTISAMKKEGNVYAANITLYNEGKEINHNVVVLGVTGGSNSWIRYWDNAVGDAGAIRIISPSLINELYRFNKPGYNPWLPKPLNTILPNYIFK